MSKAAYVQRRRIRSWVGSVTVASGACGGARSPTFMNDGELFTNGDIRRYNSTDRQRYVVPLQRPREGVADVPSCCPEGGPDGRSTTAADEGARRAL
jgi:hypothetical protein